MRSFMKKALATAALLAMTAGAQAAENVVWWDFLSGGDGVRMKTLIGQYNKEHPDIQIQATTLEWGVPFYTKVQTSAAVGEGPDIMTYHESRIPLGVSTGSLREITPDELKAAGLSSDNYVPANWKAAQVDGKQYAIPFDIHSIILYYNKDLLKKAGLLGDDGLPKGLDGAANFEAALAKLTTGPDQVGLSIPTADGGTVWRIFYTLLAQQGGDFITGDKVLDGGNADKATKALTEMAKWVKSGWVPKQTEYPASIALFTSGKAAMHINGVWEVTTMTDLAKSGKLGFDWGAIQIPVIFDQPATWADSHSFAIPDRKGKEISPEKVKTVLSIIKWFNEHSLFWATAGHVPAFLPVTNSDDFKKMQPNAVYSSLTKTAKFDPSSKLTGVASPTYEAATNYFMPAFNGDGEPADAVSTAKDELQGLLQ